MNRGIMCNIESNLYARHMSVIKLTMKLLTELMADKRVITLILQSLENSAAVQVAKLYAEVFILCGNQ